MSDSDAIEHRLKVHLHAAATTCPSIAAKHITMHTLRHTAAMRLLLAGNDITVIALWLGHEHISTTNVYLHADMTHKQHAIDRTKPTAAKPGSAAPCYAAGGPGGRREALPASDPARRCPAVRMAYVLLKTMVEEPIVPPPGGRRSLSRSQSAVASAFAQGASSDGRRSRVSAYAIAAVAARAESAAGATGERLVGTRETAAVRSKAQPGAQDVLRSFCFELHGWRRASSPVEDHET